MVLDYQILIQFYDNSAWTDFSGGITAGSLHLEKMIVKEEISFGVMYASKFECEIFNVSDDYSGKRIRVVKRKSGEDDEYLFTGKVDCSNTDYTGVYRDIVSYDEFYYIRNLNVSAWWNSLWVHEGGETVSYTLGQMLTSLCEYVGISISEDTAENLSSLPNASVTMTDAEVGSYSKITFEDVLHSITELMGVFPSINGNGEMELISLNTDVTDFSLKKNDDGTFMLIVRGDSYISNSDLTLDSEEASITDNADGTKTTNISNGIANIFIDDIEISGSHYEDYETEYINRIDVYLSSDELYLSVGNGNNGYPVSGNLFLISKNDAEITTVCNALLGAISGIKFAPCSLKMIVADLDFRLGMRFDSNSNMAFIFGLIMSGTQFVEQTINCDSHGKSITQKPSAVNNERVLRSNVGTVTEKTGTVTMTEVTDMVVQAVSSATQIITGGAGSYVILGKDSNGYITDIYIANSPGVDSLGHPTAEKLWRWNSGGLGFSSNGWDGDYGLALTNKGEIVANMITTGTLNAEVFNASSIFVNANGSGGTIEENLNQLSSDFDSLRNGAIFKSFYVIDDGVHIMFRKEKTGGYDEGEIYMDGANIFFKINGTIRSVINADGFNFDYGILTTALQIGKNNDGTATNATWTWTKSQSGHFRLVYRG